MDADTQSIAVLMIDSSIPMKLITDPIAIKMIVRMMKNVNLISLTPPSAAFPTKPTPPWICEWIFAIRLPQKEL